MLGSVSKLEARTSLVMHSIHTEAIHHTRGLDANIDETGWKQGPNKVWLWVAVTNSATAFPSRRHRERGVFDDLVGASPGVLTNDRYSAYKHLKSPRCQVYWAQIRRDFQVMSARRDRGSSIGYEMLLYADILDRLDVSA